MSKPAGSAARRSAASTTIAARSPCRRADRGAGPELPGPPGLDRVEAASGKAMTFRSIYRHGFARVAACTVRTALADPAANAEAVLRNAREAHERGAALVVFPELILSGYSIEDLLLQDTLLDAVERAVEDIVARSGELMPLLLIGAPLRHLNRVYNTALAVHRGRLLGVVPKIHLPNYREFYEPRWFASGHGTDEGEIQVGGVRGPLGAGLL